MGNYALIEEFVAAVNSGKYLVKKEIRLKAKELHKSLTILWWAKVAVLVDIVEPGLLCTLSIGADDKLIGDALSEVMDLKKTWLEFQDEITTVYVKSKWLQWLQQIKGGIMDVLSETESELSIFIDTIIDRLIGFFDKRFPPRKLVHWQSIFRWVNVTKYNGNLDIFKRVFTTSVSKFIKEYNIDVDLAKIDVESLWDIARNAFESNYMWTEITESYQVRELVKIVDVYRSIACTSNCVERIIKEKNKLLSYSDNSLNIIMFIKKNCAVWGSQQWFKMVKKAIGFANVLRSKKYRESIKYMVYGPSNAN